MKICLITDGTMPVPSIKGGAVEQLIDSICKENELHKKIDLCVVSKFDQEALEESKKYHETKFIYVKEDSSFEKKIALISRAFNKLSRILFKNEISIYSAFYRRALKETLNYNFDLIICEGSPIPSAFSIFRKKYKFSKLCIHLHGNLIPSKFTSKIFGSAIGVSDFVSNEYKKGSADVKNKIYTLYNCINNDVFSQRLSLDEAKSMRRSLGFNENDFVVGFCGRICKEKGIRELIEATLQCEGVKLLIIGSPGFAYDRTSIYLDDVKRISEENSDRIKYSGYVCNKDIWKYHSCMNVFAVPSIWEEPAGLVVIEAMTSGLPLIVTKSGGIQEYVDEDCAISVDRNGVVENLIVAINKLKSKENLCKKMSHAAFDRSKCFSESLYYNNFVEILEDILRS